MDDHSSALFITEQI